MDQPLKYITGLAVVLLLLLLILKQCQNAKLHDEMPIASHSEKHDTLYLPGDTVYLDTIVYYPYPVYSQAASTEQKAQHECDSLRAYADSLQIDSTSMVYYSDTVLGKKLTYRLTYKGVPYVKIIKESIHDSVIHIENRKIYTNGFFISGEVGGNLTRFNYSAGADYVSKDKWMLGYRYGINEKTHNLKFGLKIF